MRPGKLHGIATAVYASWALISGVNTLSHNNEAVRAEICADAYQQLGDQGQAAQFEAQASDARRASEIPLGLTVLSLGLVGVHGSLAVRAYRRRDEQAQETQVELNLKD